MTLLFMDGFDHYGTAQLQEKYLQDASGYSISGVNAAEFGMELEA